MIITGGENVFPIEIENVISLHPDVNEVVIVGLKDEKWGPTFHPLVQLLQPH